MPEVVDKETLILMRYRPVSVTVMVFVAAFTVYNVVSSFHSIVLIMGARIVEFEFTFTEVSEASLLYLTEAFRDVLIQLGEAVVPLLNLNSLRSVL